MHQRILYGCREMSQWNPKFDLKKCALIYERKFLKIERWIFIQVPSRDKFSLTQESEFALPFKYWNKIIVTISLALEFHTTCMTYWAHFLFCAYPLLLCDALRLVFFFKLLITDQMGFYSMVSLIHPWTVLPPLNGPVFFVPFTRIMALFDL